MRRNSLPVALTIMVSLLFGTFATQAQAPLKIVASFSILQDVVQNIAGDTAEVSALIPAGVDPHTFSPSPRDIAAIAESDIVFINGADFEELLLDAIRNAGANAPIVIASSCVSILPILIDDPLGTELAADPVATAENVDLDAMMTQRCQAHQAEIQQLNTIYALSDMNSVSKVQPYGALYSITCGAHHPPDELEHSGCDPHVWTNPQNVIHWSLMIRDTLIDHDPANAAIYTANAAAYIAEIEQLTHDFIIPALNSVPATSRILVTNHDTLGYFANAFGYTIIGTIVPGGSTTSEPSAADIGALIDTIKQEKVAAVFAENTVNARIAEQVAAESGAQFYSLLTDSLTAPGEAGSTYLDYLRYNVTTIAGALGGTLPASN